MAGPRLIKLTCPECGAAMRVDAGVEVVTCVYCGKSSVVHWPDRPARPAPTVPDYGNIHVPPEAMRAASTAMILMVVVPTVVFGLIGGAIAVISAVTASPRPAVRMSTPGAGGPACERAVTCCKAIQSSNTGCDGLRLMSEADCQKQANSLELAAKALGKSCK